MMFFHRLKDKFGFTISLILILFFLFQSFITIRQTEKRLIENVNREVENFSQLSSKPLFTAYQLYYFSGFQRFKEIVQDINKSSPSISRIRLVNMKGEILFDTQDFRIISEKEKKIIEPKLLEEARRLTPSYIYENRKANLFSEVIVPLVDEWGGHQYSFVYSVSYKIVEKEKLSAIFRTISLTFILLILSLLIISFLINRITTPLSELKEGAKIVGRGNLEYKLNIKTGDEIEELADEFNIMIIKLKALIGGLEEAKATLEIKVKERTRDLEEERNKTLAIINNFEDGILVFDGTSKLILINPKAKKMLKSEEELVGKDLNDLELLNNFKPLVGFLKKKNGTIFRQEISFSENLIYQLTIIPLVSEKEELGKIVVLHDISREKLVERMKSEFVSLAAHQLRTPLSIIKWIIKMFLDEDLGRLTREQKEFLEKAYLSNERMISLINDLLNVARIEEGRYVYKFVLIDFVKLINEVITSRQKLIQEKKIKFNFQEPSEKVPLILMDPEKIKLVIENLLDNAIKYTKAEGTIQIALKRNFKEKEIEFEIKDNGVGIPQNQQERVFSKFFRGFNVMKLETAGTGLGLFISKNIVEAHGGKIWFYSKENEGTTFYFTLPLSSQSI
jgi:signal transduction histidine kinase